MSGSLEDIHLVLPELLRDFDNIQNSRLTSLQASRAIAKSFKERLDLYYSSVTRVEGNFAVFDIIFGSQDVKFRNDMEYFLTHLPLPREIPKHVVFSKIVSEKALRIATFEERIDTTFSSALLPAAASWIWFPVIKEDQVISIIELGSDTIIELQRYWNDEEVSKTLSLAFEALQFKINRILEHTRD